MKRKTKGNVLVILLVCIVAAAGIGTGVCFLTRNRMTEPVQVYPFMNMGMTEYWGDSQESYGPVSTDRIQTVFLSNTQSVTEVLVQQGDTVKKGDLLMVMDTTLNDISMERERLELEKLKLKLSNAEDELKDIKKMKPMSTPKPKPTTPPEEEDNKGVPLSGDYQISQNKDYDGSSKEKSLILWLRDSAGVEDAVLESVRKKAEEYQNANLPTPTDPTEPSVPTEPTDPTEPGAGSSSQTETDPTDPVSPTDPTDPVPPQTVTVKKFYMIIKVTEGNMSLGTTKTWQGLEVTKKDNGFTFRLFDAYSVADHSKPQPSDTTKPTTPQVNLGSGYTSAQIAQMKADKEKEIKDLQFQLKMAEANYEIKKTEMESGEIVAQIDGTIVSLLTEEEAQETMQPILKLSGGGGFYVECSVSELTKENLQIGQEVTVNDWNTGMVYTGSVQSIGDFPGGMDGWNGMGNPNASYYPFTVFIDESADLQEGSYVNVVYSTATNQQGIYLENPFLRTEQGKSYVYVKGADGTLEKRFVTTGKSLWGSYTEILSGLTPDDWLAFPYGKNLTEGAPTVESDISELYSY